MEEKEYKQNFNNSNNTIMENFSDWLLSRPHGVDCDFVDLCNGEIYGTDNEVNLTVSFKMSFNERKPRKKDKK